VCANARDDPRVAAGLQNHATICAFRKVLAEPCDNGVKLIQPPRERQYEVINFGIAGSNIGAHLGLGFHSHRFLLRYYRRRVSVDVHDALDLVITGFATKELALVIKISIDVGASPSHRRSASTIWTKRSFVRAEAARRQSLIWHLWSPDAQMNESLKMCREIGKTALYRGRSVGDIARGRQL
jgi:hypothetical protein